MIKDILSGLALYIISALLILIYSLIIYITGHSFWPDKAKGNLIIDDNNNIRGSYLLVQNLERDKYFQGRMQKQSNSKCDVAIYNNDFKKMLLDRYYKAGRPDDASFITSSSSHLDPYVMKATALKQAGRIATARNMNVKEIITLIENNTTYKAAPFFELDIVNTTILNAGLDGLKLNGR